MKLIFDKTHMWIGLNKEEQKEFEHFIDGIRQLWKYENAQR